APFVSVLNVSAPGAIFPRILIIAGANSKFSFIQVFEGAGSEAGEQNGAGAPALCDGLTEVYVSDAASVNYMEVNRFSHNVLCFNRTHNEVASDGSFFSLTVA